MIESLNQILTSFNREYAKTPTKLKLLDGFSVFCMQTLLIQFIYATIVGSFPFNACLSGLLACLGMLVFTICLRLQTDPDCKEAFGFSTERAFADYCFASLTLFLVAWNYMG